MDLPLGQISALGAAICWAFCSLCFTEAGKKIGSLQVGLIRMTLGTIMLSLYCWFSRGHLFPYDATSNAWWYLSMSGFIGFFIGDVFLFRSFLLIGPRMSLLIMTSWPVIAALIEWVFLSKQLVLFQLVGISLTIIGISWVIIEQNKDKNQSNTNIISRNNHIKGIVFALLGASGQAIGLVWSKFGMELEGGQYDAFSATQIRAFSGLAGYMLLFFFLGRWHKLKALKGDHKSMLYLVLGSASGPFLGVTLSLIALHHTTIGIAATLTASSPIFIIPLVIIYYKEKVNIRAIFGTILALGGVSILFLQ